MISGGAYSKGDLFSLVFSDDVGLIEGSVYGQPFIYKYYHFSDMAELRTFFSRPTLRFTHKDDLNDPFELTRRWEKFGYPFKAGIVEKYVGARLERQLLDVRNVRKRLLNDPRTKTLGLSRQKRRQIVATRIGRAQIETELRVQMESLKTIEQLLPIVFQGHEDELIEDFAKTSGILSLTEDADSAYMWREYAADGAGFVLKFDAKNPFFSYRERGRKVHSLLRKVIYRDDRVDEFWKNPYYLFLVKEKKWSFEKEWRVLKALDQCEVREIDGRRILYLLKMPPRLIKEIVFGYRWSSERVTEMRALIHQYDRNIDVSVMLR